jgi:predicted HicB family RNase H-like nuclease
VIAVRVEEELYTDIRKAAEASGRSLSEEVEARLQDLGPKALDDLLPIVLKIPSRLRQAVEEKAQKHHTGINNMIRLLLEDAIAGTEARALEDIRMDMEHAWARFAQRFLLLEVSHELTAQLARSKDKDVAKLARKFPRRRAAPLPPRAKIGKVSETS